jgi:sugar transferase (PEP-CTERM/EpsH1 system associated)
MPERLRAPIETLRLHRTRQFSPLPELFMKLEPNGHSIKMFRLGGDAAGAESTEPPPRAGVSRHAGRAPLIAHVIYRLHIGGLENGLVNLINHMPPERFRHAIICLTDYSDFRQRLLRTDVPLFALNKPPGNSPRTLVKLWRLLCRLQPDIVHTRNLAALDGAVSAAAAGVRIRIHGEHGRDVGDLDGSNVRYQNVRRLFKPFVHQYVALSKDLEQYLLHKVRVRQDKIAQLYNGVETDVFRPAEGRREPLADPSFACPDSFLIGTVGRMQAVKDQTTLARAFVLLLKLAPHAAARARLVMIGDGPLLAEVEHILKQAGIRSLAWLPGARDDVSRIMRGLDLFVLPSLAEGISNTILEAMASGLPVVATAVGGNPELIDEGQTGQLVPKADPEAMAHALLRYFENPSECRRQGLAARRKTELHFSMPAMVDSYTALYERMLGGGKS